MNSKDYAIIARNVDRKFSRNTSEFKNEFVSNLYYDCSLERIIEKHFHSDNENLYAFIIANSEFYFELCASVNIVSASVETSVEVSSAMTLEEAEEEASHRFKFENITAEDDKMIEVASAYTIKKRRMLPFRQHVKMRALG
jgi:hypothetical protein